MSDAISTATRALAALVLLAAPALASAGAACRDVTFESLSYTVCEADPASDDVRLWLDAPDGRKLGSYDRLAAMERAAGRDVVFAVNGGMYHADRRPVGLYVEEGEERAPLVLRDGPGNFGLLPNGVLCLDGERALVMESRAFAARAPDCRFATQSGPMLVIDGALHPRFLPGSTSRNLRNGVGVTHDGRLVAAISNEDVTFHEFARFFRDALGTPNALFLDGSVSRLYAPGLGRHDIGFPIGPMLGATRPAD